MSTRLRWIALNSSCLAMLTVGCTNSSCVPAFALLAAVERAGVRVNADSVQISFEGGEPYDCPSAGTGVYHCAGTQTGTYSVTVTFDGEEHVKSADLEGDACGIIDPVQLDFSVGESPSGSDAGAE